MSPFYFGNILVMRWKNVDHLGVWDEFFFNILYVYMCKLCQERRWRKRKKKRVKEGKRKNETS